MTPREAGGRREGGRLLVVATPLGNLGDITSRAVEALREADVVVCEDTRRTRKLLSHLGLSTATRSHHKFNEAASLARLISLLEEGRTLALVSDAGTPGVSDPGSRLVDAAWEQGILVEAVPGASAAAAAVSVSGMEASGYLFAGYPPSRATARRRFLEALRAMEGARVEADPKCDAWPLVFFEAPHRIAASLQAMAELLGDRRAVLFREMTKLHEETLRGTVSEIRAALGEGRVRGEITLVVEGSTEASSGEEAGLDLAEGYERLTREGADRKEALRRLARMTGRSRREIYRELFSGRDEDPG